MNVSAESDFVRITFVIDKATAVRLKAIPWGLKSGVIRALLNKVLDAIDTNGLMICGAIIDGQYDLIYTKGTGKKNEDRGSRSTPQ